MRWQLRLSWQLSLWRRKLLRTLPSPSRLKMWVMVAAVMCVLYTGFRAFGATSFRELSKRGTVQQTREATTEDLRKYMTGWLKPRLLTKLISTPSYYKYDELKESVITKSSPYESQRLTLRTYPHPQFVNATTGTFNISNISESLANLKIYIYPLPRELNNALVDCVSKNYNNDMCFDLSNGGFGSAFQVYGNVSFHQTHKFSLEAIFHSKLKSSPYTTTEPNTADLFYIPYYATLNCFCTNPSDTTRDSQFWDILLKENPYLKDGRPHFMALGRTEQEMMSINCPFLAQQSFHNLKYLAVQKASDLDRVFTQHESQENETILVPYPSYIHFNSPEAKVDSSFRSLFAFMSASTANEDKIRDLIALQLSDSKLRYGIKYQGYFHKLPSSECLRSTASSATNLMDLMRKSTFCLQSPGDTSLTKTFYDALLSGCIPVLLTPTVKLPFAELLNYSDFTVTINRADITDHGMDVIQILRRIPRQRVRAMKQTLASIVRFFQYGLYNGEDAFMLILHEVMQKFKSFRGVENVNSANQDPLQDMIGARSNAELHDLHQNETAFGKDVANFEQAVNRKNTDNNGSSLIDTLEYNERKVMAVGNGSSVNNKDQEILMGRNMELNNAGNMDQNPEVVRMNQDQYGQADVTSDTVEETENNGRPQQTDLQHLDTNDKTPDAWKSKDRTGLGLGRQMNTTNEHRQLFVEKQVNIQENVAEENKIQLLLATVGHQPLQKNQMSNDLKYLPTSRPHPPSMANALVNEHLAENDTPKSILSIEAVNSDVAKTLNEQEAKPTPMQEVVDNNDNRKQVPPEGHIVGSKAHASIRNQHGNAPLEHAGDDKTIHPMYQQRMAYGSTAPDPNFRQAFGMNAVPWTSARITQDSQAVGPKVGDPPQPSFQRQESGNVARPPRISGGRLSGQMTASQDSSQQWNRVQSQLRTLTKGRMIPRTSVLPQQPAVQKLNYLGNGRENGPQQVGQLGSMNSQQYLRKAVNNNFNFMQLPNSNVQDVMNQNYQGKLNSNFLMRNGQGAFQNPNSLIGRQRVNGMQIRDLNIPWQNGANQIQNFQRQQDVQPSYLKSHNLLVKPVKQNQQQWQIAQQYKPMSQNVQKNLFNQMNVEQQNFQQQPVMKSASVDMMNAPLRSNINFKYNGQKNLNTPSPVERMRQGRVQHGQPVNYKGSDRVQHYETNKKHHESVFQNNIHENVN